MKAAAAVTRLVLDVRLVRAMREGGEVLPEDLDLLRGYLRLLDGLLAEKAGELEPTWRKASEAAVEIETLQSLEAVVAERAIGVRADDIPKMRLKFEIWRALSAGAEEGDMTTTSNRLVLSIAADLDRFEQSEE